MDLTNTLINIEGFGIDLKLETKQAEEYYINVLRDWFVDERDYEVSKVKGTEFYLSKDGTKIAGIYISSSILRIRPIVDEPYDVLLDILDFIAHHHKQVVTVFNYLETNDEAADKVMKVYGTKTEEEVVEEKEDSDDDSDDLEWI